MIGERLSEIRKDHGDKQADLASFLCVSLSTIRSWEQGKSSPPHEALVSICNRYHISADYLLGISNVDPAYKPLHLLTQLTQDELRELQQFGEYLIWRRSQHK